MTGLQRPEIDDPSLVTVTTGMGDLRFLSEFRGFFFIFRVEIIAFSLANSHLISSLQVFVSFLVPIPGY